MNKLGQSRDFVKVYLLIATIESKLSIVGFKGDGGFAAQ
jgi:hypothetical protein